MALSLHRASRIARCSRKAASPGAMPSPATPSIVRRDREDGGGGGDGGGGTSSPTPFSRLGEAFSDDVFLGDGGCSLSGQVWRSDVGGGVGEGREQEGQDHLRFHASALIMCGLRFVKAIFEWSTGGEGGDVKSEVEAPRKLFKIPYMVVPVCV